MRTIYGFGGLKNKLKGSVVAIGTFDGIHRGHQVIIRKTVTEAKRRGEKAVVITFDMHPQNKLNKNQDRIYSLSAPETKKEIMKLLKVDMLVIVNFAPGFANMPPEKFVKDIICAKFKAGKIIVGEDFHFGRDRGGDVSILESLGKKHGFKVSAVAMIKSGGRKISSTRIRKLILTGKVEEAAKLLDRPYSVSGKIVKGAGRGSKMDFPTANLKIENGIALPAPGVYEVRAKIKNKSYSGAANIGYRPTFITSVKKKKPGEEPLVEVHVCDYSENIYGKTIAVSFLKRIRPEKKFLSGAKLSEQIKKDIRCIQQNNNNLLLYERTGTKYVGQGVI